MLKMIIVALIGYGYISYKIYSLYFSKFSPFIVMPITMIILFSMIIFKALEYSKGITAPPQIMLISYMIMGVSVFLLIAFIGIDILALFKVKTVFSFQIKYLALIVVAVATIYGYFNHLNTRLTTYDIITDKKLEREFKLLFVSDIHIDDIMSDKHLEKYVDMINKTDADILLIGGDIIDIDIKHLTESKKEILAKLNKRSYAVLGNHEYYSGDINTVIKEIEDTGIIVIRDDVINFEGMNIIGRDTRARSFKGMNIDNRKAMSVFDNISKDNYTIVIEHIPDRTSIEENKAFKSDMMLSGHTHGGQFFPVNIIVKFIYDNAYGLKRFDNLTTVVSSGVYLWGARLRVGSISEMVLINLRNE